MINKEMNPRITKVRSPCPSSTAWPLFLTTNKQKKKDDDDDDERAVVTAPVPGAHSRPRPPRPPAPGCAPPTPRPPSDTRARKSADCSPLAVSKQVRK